jgi:aquaporin Z
MNKYAVNKYAAELVGTFILVFVGIGTAVLESTKDNSASNVGVIGVAFAFGFALLAIIYTIGPISGAHVNPAVTIGLWISKKIEGRDVPWYIVFQIIGGILGAGVVLFIAKGHGYSASGTGFASNGYGEHSPFGNGYDWMSAFLAEVVLTGLLVLTVHGATDVKAPVGFAGLAIGLVLVGIHLVGIPVDNLSANPARSIATAVFARGWALQQLWLFIVAPIIGGILAALVYKVIRVPDAVISTETAEQALKSEQAERG